MSETARTAEKNHTEGTPSYIFSDETELFRSPSEPSRGDLVTLRIRTAKNYADCVELASSSNPFRIKLDLVKTDEHFDFYETKILCGENKISYMFAVHSRGKVVYYGRNGEKESFGDVAQFCFTPGFHVPEWAKGAVQYQIFPDRFFNGEPGNDVCDNEYYYVSGHSVKEKNWYEYPGKNDIRTFYGGDLQGVAEKLGYLQSLGVRAIYLNPIFVSPSSHKYDVQDYMHIDPHLAVIEEDTDHAMQDWEKHNGFAPKYIKRTTSPVNLSKSDDYFAFLCEEIHKRGMRIILDGVFNHCGSFNKWMDREGIYIGKKDAVPGAFQSENSPYREYFTFREKEKEDDPGYEAWWGVKTLPKLNYEGSSKLCEEIFSIAEKWAKPPYSIDGWRLDVAADLGHSEEFNHRFWKEFRKRLKNINPDLLILAEHYGDPSAWLGGDQWDSVMNYDAFMDPLSYFLTGMEKHSDKRNEDLFNDGVTFFGSMRKNASCFQHPSLLCAMNELSNHDHSRFLTRTNMNVGRMETKGSKAADENINKGIFREAVVIQMTWPGAPTIYYGDEAGVTGWTDPDSRRTFPWGREDNGLTDLYRALSSVRSSHPVLKTGSLVELSAGYGSISYARFDGCSCAVISCNNTDRKMRFDLDVRAAQVADGSEMYFEILTGADGFRSSDCSFCGTECSECGLDLSVTVKDGMIHFTLPPYGACVIASKNIDYLTEKKHG